MHNTEHEIQLTHILMLITYFTGQLL